MPYLLALTGINKRGSILHPLATGVVGSQVSCAPDTLVTRMQH